jgi:hypothetical protein
VLESQVVEYVLSHHAADMLQRRGIRREWLEAAMASPQRVERDAADPSIVHHLRTVEACEGRVLRVLYNEAVSPVRIVSVYLDRRMKGKL